MSASDLSPLALSPALEHGLKTAAINSIENLRDSTIPKLQGHLSETQIREALARLDFYYDRRFRSEMLCPMLPEPAYYVEVQYLDLSSELIVQLEQKHEYLYELALSRRYSLGQILSEQELTDVEFALFRFLEAYRQEEIVLEFEEEDD